MPRAYHSVLVARYLYPAEKWAVFSSSHRVSKYVKTVLTNKVKRTKALRSVKRNGTATGVCNTDDGATEGAATGVHNTEGGATEATGVCNTDGATKEAGVYNTDGGATGGYG